MKLGIVRVVVVGSVAGLVVVLMACGKGEKADEGQAKLASFKAFVAKELPGTKKEQAGQPDVSMSCTWKLTDVKKTDSTASPYQGILKGQGAMILHGVEAQGHVFDLRFAQDGDAWKCSDVDSSNMTEAGPQPDACVNAKIFCSGK